MKKQITTIIALALIATGATTGQAQPTNSASDRLVVELPDQTLTLSHRCSVGALNEPDEELFGSSQSVLVDTQGRLLIADRSAGDLRWFDRTCAFVSATGQRGQGPNEFQWVSSLLLEGEDTLMVFDNNAARLSRYRMEEDLVHIGDFPIDLAPTTVYRLYAEQKGEGFWVVGHVMEKRELIHAYDASGRHERSFGVLQEIDDDDYDSELVWTQVNQGLLVQQEDGSKIIALRSPYKLVKYDVENDVEWTVTEDVWEAPWEGYISITKTSYQVGFYPQILFAERLTDEVFLIEHANFETEKRFLDFRSVKTGALVHRTQVDYEQQLVALSRDSATSGYAVFKSSVDYPRFSLYHWALQ